MKNCNCCHEDFSYPMRDSFCIECCNLTIQGQIERKTLLRKQMSINTEHKRHAYVIFDLKKRNRYLKKLVKELETDRQEILRFTTEIQALKQESSVRFLYLFTENNEKDWLERYKDIIKVKFYNPKALEDADLPF
ncbi:TPA: hypothetical protein ACGW8Q_005723 [Bacillus cereus]|uniref:hypothetical protein n=1 Tax=Bacillus cereus group TaxID=86661 RepID=UPI0022E708E4|nr:hypothetical protein [Bacillus mobilis]